MEEFEPKLKKKVFDRRFFSKYIYIIVIGLVFLLGVSYSITFFVQNKSVATGTLTTGSLTVTYTDRNINATELSVPANDQEGLSKYVKTLSLENTSNIDGIVKLTLTRTSGLNLTDMSYALVVNGAIQKIDNVPGNGEILETAILGGSPSGEHIDIVVRLWPKTTYAGVETTFVGELTPTLSYLGRRASSLSSPAGKYVNFNCDGSTCEVWQIVKVEDERLVLTRQADYSGATSRTNSNKYNPDSFNPAISFNDDSLISSLSTDGLNVYLAKTVKITGGSGTSTDPYTLENNVYSEKDKKKVATITYKNGNTTTGTQNVYYNETNYISQKIENYDYWANGANYYELGEVITFTSDITLAATSGRASELEFDNTITNFDCDDAQCAVEHLK